MLVHVKEPPTEIRLIGRGAAEVLAGLTQAALPRWHRGGLG